jgi:hypothetical protein
MLAPAIRHLCEVHTTMRLTKTLGMAGALLLSAILGGTLIGSAFAADKTTTTDTTTADATAGNGQYCDVFLDELASQLGTDRDGLVGAGKAAAEAAIDAAVANGDLDADRAEALKQRIADADGDGCGWIGGGFVRGFHMGMQRGAARGFVGGDVFEAAADALGIDSADLIGQLRDAGSLEALAESLGVSYDDVKASVLASVQADLDAAVAEGLPQEHADAVIERVTAWLDDGGQAGGWGPARGFGPHFRGPFHDDGDADTDADSSSDNAGA